MTHQTQTFIGSSSEGLVVAKAIEANISQETDCMLWTKGVFIPGRTFIEALEKALREMDYAILVASPDDMLTKRDTENFSMRDNVLFELGLFMAKLGRGRAYLVSPADQPIHLPSDLLGLTTVTYESAQDDGDWTQALADPCEDIRSAMREAEKEVSRAMRRTLVSNLLKWITTLQRILVTVQSRSLKSILDRSEFERVRQDMAEGIVDAFAEYREDAERLGLSNECEQLTETIVGAVEAIPFPEEAAVSSAGELVGGLLEGLAEGRSVEEQVRRRVDSLVDRYDYWWSEYGPRIGREVVELQGALIAEMPD